MGSASVPSPPTDRAGDVLQAEVRTDLLGPLLLSCSRKVSQSVRTSRGPIERGDDVMAREAMEVEREGRTRSCLERCCLWHQR